MTAMDYDEDEFGDFMSKVDDVTRLVEGLKDGTVDPKEIDVFKEEDKLQKEYAAREAKKAAKRAEEEAKVQAAVEERKRREEFREANRDKLEELKQNYYLRKALRCSMSLAIASNADWSCTAAGLSGSWKSSSSGSSSKRSHPL